MIYKPVFVIGMPRSGTTVISEAISLHEEFGWISNYLTKFPNYVWISMLNRLCFISKIGIYIRGRKPQTNNLNSFFRKFFPYPSEAYNIWEIFLGKKFRNDYLFRKVATEEERKNVIEYFKKVLKYQGKKRLFVKLTGPPRIQFLTSIFPDAYFIHVIRDPRAVVNSLLKVKFWREGGGLERPWWKGLPQEYIKEWEKRNRSPVALAALQWKRVVSLTWEEKKYAQHGHFIEIRYEDFVEKPHEYLTKIFHKVGLEDSPEAHKYISSIGKLRNMNY